MNVGGSTCNANAVMLAGSVALALGNAAHASTKCAAKSALSAIVELMSPSLVTCAVTLTAAVSDRSRRRRRVHDCTSTDLGQYHRAPVSDVRQKVKTKFALQSDA